MIPHVTRSVGNNTSVLLNVNDTSLDLQKTQSSYFGPQHSAGTKVHVRVTENVNTL